MSLNLTAAGLADHKAWEAAGYALPSYPCLYFSSIQRNS